MTLTSGPGVIKGSMKSGLSSASSTENDAVQMPEKTISTKPVVRDPSATKESDEEGDNIEIENKRCIDGI